MANIKITDLTELNDPDSTDVLPIVDVGADVTKKVTVGEVVGKISGDVDVATDGTSSIASGVIVNGDINASAAIAGTKIDPNFGSQTVETTGDLAINTDVLFVDSSKSAVGIGTTNPGSTLEVNGDTGLTVHPTSASTAGQIRIAGTRLSGASAVAVVDLKAIPENPTAGSDASSFAIETRASSGTISEKARIDSSGRLLVGTSSARETFDAGARTARFQIEGTDAGTSTLSVTRNSTSAFAGIIRLCKTKGSSIGSNTIVADDDSLGEIIFEGADGTNTVRAARITAEVDGTPGANDMPGRLVFSTTADGASSPTERMRITSTGGIKFNTTSDTIDSSNFGTTIGSNSVGNPDAGLFRTARNQSGVQVVLQAFGNAGQFRTMGDGDAENTNNSYGAISDIKLKENIVDANSQWNDLKALQVRNYNFKAETGYNTHTQIGLVAQEVELVSPGLVGESIDEETGESTKSVNYSVLYMKAVKALQEAMERIEVLEAKVNALEAN